ncbi:MAG: Smr/MutS family protein [Oscillospiraceae bacterium]|mgnify:CR=1 FL=1|nr:Smr/MutS family protein [Oscillospiraceae bacterium]
MTEAVRELDLHGMSVVQARVAVDAALRRADKSVYRIRLIHGYHSGNALQTELRRIYKNHPKVLRLELGLNAGITELVLREYY